MLPGVKIIYQNGALGQVEPMADGCLGFLALGMTVDEGSQFLLETPYTLKKLSDLEDLGIAEGSLLHRNVKDFYAEAGDGTELWVMGFQWGSYFNSVLDKDNAEGAVSLLKAARGKIRGLIAFREYDEETQSGNGFEGGIDSDVMSSLPMAQGLGEWATDVLRAPIFTLIEAHAYRFDKDLEEPGVLPNLRQMQYNRVGLVIGDTEENSPNACMGVVAGRIACSPVQRKISRLKDGAVKPLKSYIHDQLA